MAGTITGLFGVAGAEQPTRRGPAGGALFDRDGDAKAEIDIYAETAKAYRTRKPGPNTAPNVPRSVEALWADYDPAKEPLDVRIVREWEDKHVVFRYVTYHVGTFKGVRARMAAFYGFPKGGKKLPAILHLHGGGQRAFLHQVETNAKRGYACLSINWGARPMKNAGPDDPNTDWGAVDPTQQNVPGYFNLKPGEKYLDPFESPRNNNWYLLTIGARRGLTFLQRQPEVDPNRLGVYGHSMGGNLTMYVAGTDGRIKVAVPSAGGQGFRTFPWPLLPEQRKHLPNGEVDLFRATLAYQSYAPRVQAALLFLGATNDFHGIMDDSYRTGALIRHRNVRFSFAPHLNHRFTPECAVTRSLWIDQHLKGTFEFPATPRSRLVLCTGDGVPVLELIPDTSKPVEQVRAYYSLDPDPQARFWRSAEAREIERGTWVAKLPLMAAKQPLFAFANVHYRLEKPEPVQFARPTETFAISTLLHTATPEELRCAGVRVTDKPSLLIDDFSNGLEDWYLLSAENPHHWQYWTRKINDPKWLGRPGYRLSFDVKSGRSNQLVVILTNNFFRPYRGKQQDFLAVAGLRGGEQWQTISLSPADFTSDDGERSLASWEEVDRLGFRAYYGDGQSMLGSRNWAGPRPIFRRLRWTAPPCADTTRKAERESSSR